METITISNKKYVIVEQKKFEQLAARKENSQRKYSLKEGKKIAHDLIDKWAKEK